MATRHFQRVLLIVDFWHACEKVLLGAKVFYGEGTEEITRWSQRVYRHLWTKYALVTYLTNSRDRMDYPRYEALDLPVGNGEVEAQCKSLVQACCKQAEMR